jgi:hypothetical protein
MRKQTNTLSPSPKGFQSPKFSDSDFEKSADSDSDSDVRKALPNTFQIFISKSNTYQFLISWSGRGLP